MRKLVILTLGFLMMAGTGFSQKGKVASALTYLENNEVEKALQAITAAEQNEKTKDWYRTYYVKGRILQAIAESKDEKIKGLAENPALGAFENYNKATKLDEKGKIAKTIELNLPMLAADFINKAVEEFQAQDFVNSMKSFEYALEVQKDPVFGDVIDTTIVYNAGLAAYNGKLWDDAIKYFKKTIDLDYGSGALYVLLKNCYMQKGDSATALKVLQDGFNKYPSDQNVIVELINFYLLGTHDNQAALNYIKLAKDKDPTNASIYFAEGFAMDQVGKTDSAIISYQKAIELDSTLFNAYYNLGALIFNNGVAAFDSCANVMDNTQYKKCIDEADKSFARSLPYLEKAHELNPKETNTMETLKVLYYRLKMFDKRDKLIKEMEEGGK
ncbi:MAG: tetratricopeptide repeat protein [Chlorobi bacterium]|nr:tetratricopeptide repeat protein [Chlorobiota bacterium]